MEDPLENSFCFGSTTASSYATLNKDILNLRIALGALASGVSQGEPGKAMLRGCCPPRNEINIQCKPLRFEARNMPSFKLEAGPCITSPTRKHSHHNAHSDTECSASNSKNRIGATVLNQCI